MKITQEKLAEKADVSLGTMKYWMCYGLLPDVETAHNMADLLEVRIEYLIRGSEKEAPDDQEKKNQKRKTAALAIKKMAHKIEKNADLIG